MHPDYHSDSVVPARCLRTCREFDPWPSARPTGSTWRCQSRKYWPCPCWPCRCWARQIAVHDVVGLAPSVTKRMSIVHALAGLRCQAQERARRECIAVDHLSCERLGQGNADEVLHDPEVDICHAPGTKSHPDSVLADELRRGLILPWTAARRDHSKAGAARGLRGAIQDYPSTPANARRRSSYVLLWAVGAADRR